MKTAIYLLLTPLLIILAISAKSQKEHTLFLRSGNLQTTSNISAAHVENFNSRSLKSKGKTFAVLQFENIPSQATKNFLSGQGVELLEYIPQNAYTVSIMGNLNAGVLQKLGVRSLIQLSPKQKMDPLLVKGHIPDWARKKEGYVDIRIRYTPAFTLPEVLLILEQKNIEVIATELQAYRVISIRVAIAHLEEVAAQPFIDYVEPLPPPDKPVNENSRNASRGNVLTASVLNGGKGLDGQGVVIGIGDGGDVQSHTDVTGTRLINRVYGPLNSHATHVHATAAGAGIVNELFRGYAPKATIVSQFFSNILTNTATYVGDYGMVITNNSYGGGGSCGYYGSYNMTSQILDQHAFDFPYLQHVFAAGNDGWNNCAPYPAGFHTTFGAFQAAKNVITVGATDNTGAMWVNSSKGPVQDGRTKPEITAMGAAVYSATLNNGYIYGWGTSFAAPAVSGGLALLYQRYRQLNGGSNPKNALMKALICNGGNDKGNSGPDFSYGFGWMHLNRSIEMLEKTQYLSSSIANSGTNNHTISVPPSTAQLKIMLYWNDPAASLLSSKALVNDLDLSVTSPSSTIHLPKILDTTATGMLNIATTGADHLNNMEQVVINNPVSGSYTVNITAAVAQNPTQEYYIVYDIIAEGTTLSYPTGGEGLVPGETVKINWDNYGISSNSFALKYSIDNGLNWVEIANNIDVNARQYDWLVPNLPSHQALIRIERNGSAFAGTSKAFTIIGIPVISVSAIQCEGYLSIDWQAIPNATDYEVLMMRNNVMLPFATTTNTTYSFSGLNKDSLYWVSVRARINSIAGRRAIAVSHQPKTGLCNGSISDNDLKLDSIIAPLSGRKFTSTELSSSAVSIRIKNLDDAPITGFTAKYKINNNNWVIESVDNTIAANANFIHTFGPSENFSAVGEYSITVVVDNNTNDPVKTNDTLTTVVKQLDNQPVNLTSPFLDNLETAVSETYTTSLRGLKGIERYDFVDTSIYGRLRTVVNTGLAFSGTKALIIDAQRNVDSPYAVSSVVGTFNLSGYDVNSNDIRLDFKGRNGYTFKNADNIMWARGSDNDAWVRVYEYENIGRSSPNLSPSIEIADSLKANGQNFSSSFQVKWSLPAKGAVSTRTVGAGLIIDDIQLYEAFNDLQIISIDTPVNLSCGLSGAVPLKITVRNSSNNPLTNIPVRYSIDGGAWVSEIIPSIGANTTLQYSFTSSLNFTSSGLYTLKALVAYPADNYRINDTISAIAHNAPLVSNFPYLQNFETGDGGWYTLGTNSSWEYGIPASTRINKAASGNKAWKTRLAGNYNDLELSYLYSPCFDIGTLAHPTLSLSLALDLENCGTTLCDGAWLEYSTDNKNWIRLADSTGSGTNWYTKTSPNNLWSIQNYTRWHVATMPLPSGVNRVRLRIALYSDEAINMEGIAIDDIHIYDSTKAIYDGVTLASPVTQNVSGNQWIDFESGGKLIASVNPNNQSMGSTVIQTFINSTAVRYTATQYYHDRSLTIKPTVVSFNDSVNVRLYFLDSETENLLNATGCGSCNKPASAYDLGISKYSDADDNVENGTISDNISGLWSFMSSSSVTKVPFGKGYYAEFKVKDFSEFWLNNGGLNKLTPLPVKLIDFTVNKVSNGDVLVKWTTETETDLARYEIELARSAIAVQTNEFVSIGQVLRNGNTTTIQSYSFTDTEAGKSGARYYRIKIINTDGSFSYSPVRALVFEPLITWDVYPNPSKGIFHFVAQINVLEKLEANLYDTKGRLLKQFLQTGSGFPQKLVIDLTNNIYTDGIYLLQLSAGGKQQSYKLYKQ
jgi:hypothetical protein